jgi:predicted nucleic acid-binding protein
LLRPIVVSVDESLAKRAGELLRHADSKNAMDAFVVALAERSRAHRIYTSDVIDIERLLSAATD